jgi:flagellar protein FliJ
MRRTQRMKTVQRAVEDDERKRAEKLAASERRVTECEAKLAELENYQQSYAQQFSARAGAGIGGAGLRDFQTFMARLAEAVKQQAHVLQRARVERDSERQRWQGAASRAKAVGGVVKRWQTEEQREIERREQSESDERSQRSNNGELNARGPQ